MSQRVAAHQSRKDLLRAKPDLPPRSLTAIDSRAARAAARVAERYAHAPSFSQMQAAEAQAALNAAEIATLAALEANAAAQAALAGLHTPSTGPRLWEPGAQHAGVPSRSLAADWEPAEPAAQSSLPSSLDDWENGFSHSRWEPDLRLLPLEPVSVPAAVRAPRRAEDLAPATVEGWEQPITAVMESWDRETVLPVEPDLPIPANLIEFPRELVATRRMRPRRAEGPFAAEDLSRQLSIFEVDPSAISDQVEESSAVTASDWAEPDWSDIELEAQPLDEAEAQDAQAFPPTLPVAPIGRRLAATFLDGVLIFGAFLASAAVAVARIGHPPTARIEEISAASVFLLIGLLYQTLFLMSTGATPGMRCARISPCTFDGQSPTRGQLLRRMVLLVLSVLPVGLGVAWILFDEDRLSWHDRQSRTYLRKY